LDGLVDNWMNGAVEGLWDGLAEVMLDGLLDKKGIVEGLVLVGSLDGWLSIEFNGMFVGFLDGRLDGDSDIPEGLAEITMDGFWDSFLVSAVDGWAVIDGIADSDLVGSLDDWEVFTCNGIFDGIPDDEMDGDSVAPVQVGSWLFIELDGLSDVGMDGDLVLLELEDWVDNAIDGLFDCATIGILDGCGVITPEGVLDWCNSVGKLVGNVLGRWVAVGLFDGMSPGFMEGLLINLIDVGEIVGMFDMILAGFADDMMVGSFDSLLTGLLDGKLGSPWLGVDVGVWDCIDVGRDDDAYGALDNIAAGLAEDDQ
jgi:hypothetical protein